MQYMNAECKYVWLSMKVYECRVQLCLVLCANIPYQYHTNIMPIQLLTRVDAFHRHSYHCLIALPICADLEFQKPTEFK